MGNQILSGVYQTNGPEACLYQAEHSKAEVIVVDSVENLKKYEANLSKLPNIKAIVMYSVDKFPPECKDPRYYLWNDFLALGNQVKDDVVKHKIAK
mmetsp:Transcript_48179/g.35369  ORF Transcript_48179/g.35369 Transcript_48179/m.35369 type:complete len:96 (+) Transcript_48179:392-679(+)|eukprot:CAMPEP_0202959032 /NCGR_PEP_ID=MMETSP1396-20130829/3293_1 /ASSEMBLY_ACC=CAM_ASM_000872 /TAXON_ID= /ORGANISM="Pseudokeronopsis sp., Strain Brazil" /LENGTH=95 /DNA_ID=CAMNT_0049677395 /DNA_START=390 /DNA_END=677 /DNA_ORIENTATION=+